MHLVMKMAPEYECIHEELVQDHSLKIKELEARAKFKEERIGEINNKIEKMDTKIDQINKNVNQLILQSNDSDKELELRLKAIETELALQKETAKNRLVIVGIGLTVLTILINIYFNLI